jgi:hypothetical protein
MKGGDKRLKNVGLIGIDPQDEIIKISLYLYLCKEEK